MMIDLKTYDGFVYAYIYGYMVDRNGNLEHKGPIVFIEECWVHERYRGGLVLAELAARMRIDENTENATHVYWYKRKQDRHSPIYPIERLYKLIKKVVN